MEVLSIVIAVGSLLFKVISMISESSDSSGNANHDYMSDSTHRIMSTDEKLENMKIDELNTCYASSKIDDYSVNRTELVLMSGQISGFDVIEIIKQQNCIFIKVRHSIPFNSGVNEYGTTFSINYIEDTKNVMVYGFKTFNNREEQTFYDIANEIITQLSR